MKYYFVVRACVWFSTVFTIPGSWSWCSAVVAVIVVKHALNYIICIILHILYVGQKVILHERGRETFIYSALGLEYILAFKTLTTTIIIIIIIIIVVKYTRNAYGILTISFGCATFYQRTFRKHRGLGGIDVGQQLLVLYRYRFTRGR